MRGRDETDLAAVLTAVARALAAENELTGMMVRACRLAVDTIEACDHADVMVVAPGGTLTVPAATDWVGIRVVSLEEEHGQGPCLDAVNTGAPIDAPDLTTETRWPQFVERCVAETPVRSSIGLPLIVGDRRIGALDLYGTETNVFDHEDRAAATLFSAHVAVAFAAAKQRLELQEALASRDLIGQAKGILMAHSHITADEAFDLLRRASQRLNQKLVTVAQDIVDRNAGAPKIADP